MSRPTISPAVSPEEIAEQIAAFLARGGQIEQVPFGKTTLGPQTMDEIHETTWLSRVERDERARSRGGFKAGHAGHKRQAA